MLIQYSLQLPSLSQPNFLSKRLISLSMLLAVQIKCWAKAQCINDPKLGTLNSYALSLLVVFHLQVSGILFTTGNTCNHNKPAIYLVASILKSCSDCPVSGVVKLE